jgi:type II secretory pathway pseudopilin PulG
MKKLLKTLLTYKFKTQKLRPQKGGFTLIELLVGLIMGALIITPLLGFVINVMTSDRQEQAKSSSEQEIQTALDYIGRDLSQAIFIYDGLGLQTVSSKLPNPSTGTEGTPVLVFWKREFIPKALSNKDDAYALSLVAYYLLKDASSSNSNWSGTTRIGRVQLNDAVIGPDPNDTTKTITRKNASPGFSTPFSSAITPTLPGAIAQSFEQRMNAWTPSGPGNINDNEVDTLIDFVDQSPFADAGLPAQLCPTDGRSVPRPTVPYLHRQTPDYSSSNVPASLKTGSFYACVNTDKTLAQVFIRGNALARNSPKSNPPTYVPSKSVYFPKASIQVQGRGLISQD